MASAALRGDLEMLKDICDSDDCSIFISPGVGMEEANLPDVFEHWTLREYVELAFLLAATGSIRHQNLRSVLLWIDGRESMEAFDFAFSPVEEPELEVLRTLTLTGKVFQVFSPQERKNQLRLTAGSSGGEIHSSRGVRRGADTFALGEGEECLLISSNDIRDFYLLFKVSKERCRRHSPVGTSNPKVASLLTSFGVWKRNKLLCQAQLSGHGGHPGGRDLAQTCH